MKICPSCRRTYSDDSLNFCLDDGSVLTFTSSDPQETLVMNAPRPSASVSPTIPSGTPTDWNTPQERFTMQPPKKKSRTWLWVLGIFAVLILVCGGGFFGIAAYLGSIAEKAVNDASIKGNKGTSNTRDTKTNTASSPSTETTASADDIDMSGWAKQPSSWGTTEYTNGELVMNSKDKGYYFVQVALDKYETEGASTRVTLRNIDSGNTTLGYGLIFHSDPSPLNKDYGFLIDTKRTRYRIVQHSPSEERTIKPWTNSSAIKTGSDDNTLEVRDKSGELEFYINGTMVTSFKNTAGPKSGVPGIYAGDALKVGFKRLQVAK